MVWREGDNKKASFYKDAFSKLRRPDSNRRPLGYEPNELPTAPLRDHCECKYRVSHITIQINIFNKGWNTLILT